jgi:beta-lactamase superfamily II metal-dependent hydrolase
MSIKVRVLQANHGDCILVTHEGPNGVFNLLIDGGNSATFKWGSPPRHKGSLCILLDELKAKEQCIDLAILTHIDDDHIGGFLRAFKSPGYLSEMVKSIWFNSSKLITDYFETSEIPENCVRVSINSPDTSVHQGNSLEVMLDEIGCSRAPLILAGQTLNSGPFTFNVLSPDETTLKKLLCIWPKEKSSADTSVATDYQLSFEEILACDFFEHDTSITNGSSIAFILRADDSAMLFLGDAHDGVVVSKLRDLDYSPESKLPVDLVKVSHHGSQYNTSRDFLELVESDRFIISSNGAIHGLPNKRAVARILAATSATIYFNYEKIIGELLLSHEKESYLGRLKGLNGDLIFNDH